MKEIEFETMLELLDLESLLRGGSASIWLMVFLIVLIFWLVRYVTDLRKEVTTAREEVSHTVSPAFMSRFTELNNIRQLKRIRDAYKRAAVKGGSGRFDLEIQREIDLLKSHSNNPPAADEDNREDDYSDQDRTPPPSQPIHPDDHNDFQD